MVQPMIRDNSNVAAYGGTHVAGGSVAWKIRNDPQVTADLPDTVEDNRQYLHGRVELLVQVIYLSSQIAVFRESDIQNVTKSTVSSV